MGARGWSGTRTATARGGTGGTAKLGVPASVFAPHGPAGCAIAVRLGPRHRRESRRYFRRIHTGGEPGRKRWVPDGRVLDPVVIAQRKRAFQASQPTRTALSGRLLDDPVHRRGPLSPLVPRQRRREDHRFGGGHPVRHGLPRGREDARQPGNGRLVTDNDGGRAVPGG